MTIMWVESEQAIIEFVGQGLRDATISYVPSQAREFLSRFDERAQHYDVLDRRDQNRE